MTSSNTLVYFKVCCGCLWQTNNRPYVRRSTKQEAAAVVLRSTPGLGLKAELASLANELNVYVSVGKGEFRIRPWCVCLLVLGQFSLSSSG